MTNLSIIIVNYNTKKLVLECLKSIKRAKPSLSYEIIIVDNASDEKIPESPEYLLIENNQNLGFAKANNLGIKASKGKYKLLLNSDTIITKNALESLVSFAENNENVGVVGSKLLNKDGSEQESVTKFPTILGAIKQYWLNMKGEFSLYVPKGDEPQKVDAVVGASFLITPQALKRVGLLNEKYFMYFEDLEYCREAKKRGLGVYYLPSSKVVHYHGASGKKIVKNAFQWQRLIPSSRIYNGNLKHFLINFILWSGQRFSIYLPFLIILLLILPTFFRLVRPGYFSMQDDLQAFRVQQMDKCFNDLQIPCRWVPDAGYQYGYPQFNYYPPFVYYLGAFVHRIGFQYIDAVKILFIAGLIFSAFSMYLLVNDLLGKWEGVVASILYAYAPYKAVEVYVRGALSEFWSLVFFPLIFWSVYKLIKTKKTKYFILLSLFFFFQLTTHLLMTLTFLLPLGVWTLYFLFKEKNKKIFWVVIYSFLLGGGLASFFLLPVVFEKKYAHLESLLQGYFDYRQHFVNIYKIFISREWGYGSSGFPKEKLNLSLGLIQWVWALVAIPLILIKRRLNKETIIVLLLFLTSIFTIFLIHMKSSFIWSALPFLSWLQFPWRFLTVSIFLLALLAGYTTKLLGEFKYKIGSLIIFLAIILNFGFFIPKDWINITDVEKFSGISWEKQITISIFDYLPIYAKLPPWGKAPNLPEVLSGDGSFMNYKKGSDFQEGEYSARVESLVRAPIFDYPGMKVWVDGQVVSHWNNDCSGQKYCLGLITFKVPPGVHRIKIKLENTTVRSLGNLITLVSIGLLSIIAIKMRRNDKLLS